MLVSFAIVAYNEEKALPKLLNDLSFQDYPKDKTEVLLINSMSTDATREIMETFKTQHTEFYSVSIFDNPKKNIPSGHNIALRNATGDAIIRIDAHSSMPSSFISKNVEVLKSGEFASGGRRPNIIDGVSSWKETLLCAEQSMFGSSIAPYRNSEKKRYTASLFCGMYRKEVYETVGEYNDLLPRSEDNDMSYRMRKAGYKLCYSPDIVFYQQTRNTLRKMLKQKFLNGYWIGKTLGISPKCFSIFHFVPFAFVIGIILTSILCLLNLTLLANLMWFTYLLLIFVISVIETVKKPKFTNIFLPLIFLLLHLSYGVGTLIGIIELPFWLIKINKTH